LRYISAAIMCIAMLLCAAIGPNQALAAGTIIAVPVSITPVSSAAPSTGGEIGQPYEKFKADAESQPGLFTIWRKTGKVYFEIAPSQLDTSYLLVPTLANGADAQRLLISGLLFDPHLFKFQRQADRILIVEDNPYGKAKPDTPAALSVANSFPPSVVYSSQITSIDKTTGNIVFPADFLMSDVNDVSDFLNQANSTPLARYNLNPTLSYYGPTKSFPKNVELETDLTWSSLTPDTAISAVPDSRYLLLKIHNSILELPNDGYQPRLADDRVGFFLTARRQYDDQRRGYSSFVVYLNRWNIQKSDPNAKVSPAKNPIVVYLLNEIPPEYRPAMRDGILTWNKAFEAIGITHAIEVRQQPDDPSWDPDDARYSIVRWATTPIPVFGAYGPSVADPLTGEIFRGEVVFDANEVRSYTVQYNELIDPTTMEPPAKQLACQMHDCMLGEDMAAQRDWATLAMALDGKFSEPSPQYTYDSLKQIVLHEFGHVLGLRHNFGSETIYSMPHVQNKSASSAQGIVGSVMAYTPINLSPHGQPQGALFQLVLGPWDYAQIKYGYEPIPASSPEGEWSTLESLASQYTRPNLFYSTDEDSALANGFSTDPRFAPFNLTSDPLRFAQNNLATDQRMFNILLSRRPVQGDSYEQVRRDVALILRNWYRYTLVPTTYMGAEYFTRNHKGDPNAKTPFIPYPRAEERRAYLLLDRYAFSDNAFALSPLLINSMGSSRWNHWQANPNDTGRLDFPIEVSVTGFQQLALRRMFQPNVLMRLDSMEMRTSKPGQTMSLADLFDWTDQSVYGDLQTRGLTTVNVVHRSLQYNYAILLAHIALRPDPGTPTDAVALARHHLATLSQRCTQTLNRGGLDEATQANLETIRSTADRALNAQVLTLPQ